MTHLLRGDVASLPAPLILGSLAVFVAHRHFAARPFALSH